MIIDDDDDDDNNNNDDKNNNKNDVNNDDNDNGNDTTTNNNDNDNSDNDDNVQGILRNNIRSGYILLSNFDCVSPYFISIERHTEAKAKPMRQSLRCQGSAEQNRLRHRWHRLTQVMPWWWFSCCWW